MTSPEPGMTGEVLDLLRVVPRPPEEGEPVGADPARLAALRRHLGFEPPDELRHWLRRCNGTFAGPGGIYGTGTGHAALDIERVQAMYPGWRSKRWVPVAGDGTGNAYVLDAGRHHVDADAVFFVDTMESVDDPAFIVASGLLLFLRFLLGREAGERGWPFSEAHVVARDPGILAVRDGRLLPWRA